MENQRRFVRISDAAVLTGKSQRTIRRWVQLGKIPVNRTGPVITVDIGGLRPVTASPPDNVAQEIVRLTAELERLRSVLDVVTEERDYLRQMMAGVIVRDAPQVESKRRWRWPWQRD